MQEISFKFRYLSLDVSHFKILFEIVKNSRVSEMQRKREDGGGRGAGRGEGCGEKNGVCLLNHNKSKMRRCNNNCSSLQSNELYRFFTLQKNVD